MKTYLSILKQITTIIIISFFILTLSCSDDPSSPKKEDEDPMPQETVTIGVDGGTVEKGDLTITIPAGTFDSNYEIAVSEIEDDGAFGENLSDKFYEINGIPENYSKSLKIKIKYESNINSQILWAVGKKAYHNLTGDSLIVYDLIETTDSSGYLTAYIPVIEPNNYNIKKTSFYAHPISYFVGPLLNYPILETEHFNIKYPTTLESSISQVGQILETTYDIANNKLKLSPVIKDGKKMTAVIKIQDNVIDGELEIINIKRELVNNHEFETIKLGLLENFIATYVFYLHHLGAKSDLYYDNYWLVSAITSWAQRFLSIASYNYPEKYEENAMAPFAGINSLHGGEYPDIYSHGIGMASLIEFLVQDESFGIQGLSKTYDDFLKGDELTNALLQNKQGSIIEWLPVYFKKLMNNEIYELPEDYFIKNATTNWDINNSSDTLKIFNAQDPQVDTYLDLSAKLFKINVNHKPIDETYKMRFSVQGPVDLFGLYFHVFGIQNNQVIFIESVAGIYYYEIQNLKNSYDEFLVCVVNIMGSSPYTGESDIDFKVQVGNNFDGGGGQSDLDYNLSRIDIYLQGLFEDTRWAEGTQVEYPTGVGTSHDYYDYEDTVRTISGSFYGNVFTGSFNDGEGWTQNATITLSEDQKTIIDYSFEEIFEKWGDKTIRKVSGSNIPISNSKNTLFEINGENSCSSVFEIQNMTIRNETDTSKVVDFWCNENSRVIIQFYKN